MRDDCVYFCTHCENFFSKEQMDQHQKTAHSAVIRLAPIAIADIPEVDKKLVLFELP